MAPIRDDAALSATSSSTSYVYIVVLIILSAAITLVFHCVCCRKKKKNSMNNNDGGVSMPREKSNSSSSRRRKLNIVVDPVRDISSSTTDTTGSPQDRYAKRKPESKKSSGVHDSKATTTGGGGGKKSNVGKKLLTTTAVVGGKKTKATTGLKVKKTTEFVNKGEPTKSVLRSDAKSQKYGTIHVMTERAAKANALSLMSQKKEIDGSADTPITSETFYLKTAMVAPDMEDTDFILRASYMDPSIGQQEGDRGDNVIIPSILRRRSEINAENGADAAAVQTGPKDSGNYMEILSGSDESASLNLELATTAANTASTRLGKTSGGWTATATSASKTGAATGGTVTETAPTSYFIGMAPQKGGGKASAVVKGVKTKKKRKRKKSKTKK